MYCCHPLKQSCMQAAPRVTRKAGEAEAGVGVGMTLKESPSAKGVSKEAEMGLGIHTSVLKAFHLGVEQFERHAA